jgi:hypothetical protein
MTITPSPTPTKNVNEDQHWVPSLQKNLNVVMQDHNEC